MLIQSTKLFFKGKLFRDNKKVVRQLLFGIVLGVVSMIVSKQTLGLSFILSCIIGGFVTGVLQPILFKNLRAH